MVVRCQESLSPRLDGFGLEGSEGSPRLSRRNLDSPGVRPVGLDDLDRLSSHEPHGCHHETSRRRETDRKSTRLNSSHLVISYAVFCLKKKKKQLNVVSIPTYAPRRA